MFPNSIFVWTFSDVFGLGVLALILICAALGLCWICFDVWVVQPTKNFFKKTFGKKATNGK